VRRIEPLGPATDEHGSRGKADAGEVCQGVQYPQQERCSGIVPKQTGSGGKVNLHGISKRGDTYLRTLLIHGARSVIEHAKEPGEWVEQMMKRRPKNVVVVALANKMARTIWAVLAHDRPYQKAYVSVKPA
jgi:transposase